MAETRLQPEGCRFESYSGSRICAPVPVAERSAHNRLVGCSHPGRTINNISSGPMVKRFKTSPFQGGNTSSPVGATIPPRHHMRFDPNLNYLRSYLFAPVSIIVLEYIG